MPFTFNGIGTAVCKGVGIMPNGDADAVECFVLVYLPIVPLKCVHVFEWNINRYRSIEIQWSTPLLVRAFARRWLIGGLVAAVSALVLLALDTAGNTDWTPFPSIAAGLVLLTCSAALIALRQADLRERRIRSLLPPLGCGSSDPATWDRKLLGGIKPPHELFGFQTNREAAQSRLSHGDHRGAMLAARLELVRGERAAGESLTDAVLAANLADPR